MACDRPIFVSVNGKDIPVPCGTCAPCKKRRVDEWVFRLMYEEQFNSVSSHFVTLTYDTQHVPLSPHGFMTLRKSDFQDYMKRLRKLVDKYYTLPNGLDHPSLKYYAVGEYGSKNFRPHFHAIIFNCPDSDFFSQAWSLDGVQLGGVVVGTCTTDSVAYCMKYIDKQSFRSKHRKFPKFSRDDRVLEFSLMSKGLGAGYCDNSSVRAYHRADLSRNYVTKLSGHKVAMPRYYRLRIFDEQQLVDQREVIEFNLLDKKQREEMFFDTRLPYDIHQKRAFQREHRELSHNILSSKKRSL